MNSVRVITIACWVGIAFFGLAALGGFASQGASAGFLMVSLTGFCAFVLLRLKENQQRSVPSYPAAYAPPTYAAPTYAPPTYAAPPPVHMQIPDRVTRKWLAGNVPLMHQTQIPGFLDVLRSRGWSEAEIQQKVFPLLR